MEEKGNANENSISRVTEMINNNRSSAEANSIRLEENLQSQAIEMKEKTEEIKTINKKLTQLQRQNETLNN